MVVSVSRASSLSDWGLISMFQQFCRRLSGKFAENRRYDRGWAAGRKVSRYRATAKAGLLRKRQALAPQPQPDAADRSEFAEPGKHGPDRGADGFIRMEPHLAILLAPDEAHGKAAAQLPCCEFRR
jgi:hypothetical protein